jgi:hypothetical protein
MNRVRTGFIALAVALVAAPLALAQVPGGQNRSPFQTDSHIKRTPSPPATTDRPVSLTGQTQLALDRLEGQLQIGAHQQKAWDAYRAKVIRYAEDLSRARFSARDMQDGGLSATQQFDRLTEIAGNRMTAVEEIVEAGRAVYAALGPDQKRLADKDLVLLPLRLVSGSGEGMTTRADDVALPDASKKNN